MGIKKYKHNFVAEIINSQKNKTNEDNLDNLYEYLNKLHLNLGTGYISLYHKGNRWSVGMEDWDKLSNIVGIEDFYCSINTFYAPGKHTGKYVKNLNAVIVDLDYYNIPYLKGLSAEQIINLMDLDLSYPTPNYYIDSGNGLYLIWFLEKTFATAKSKRYWTQIQKTLIDYFKDFGADAKVKDVARVHRVNTTKNSKTGRTAKLIPTGQVCRYELSDIAEYFWGIREEKEPKKAIKKPVKTKKVNKIIKLKNILTLHYNRCRDIEKIVGLRAGTKMEGLREQLLFIYRLQLLMSNVEPENALKMVLELNKSFLDPLEEREVISATKSAEENAETYFRLKDKYTDDMRLSLNEYLSNNGVYLYRNATIIKELKITVKEMEHLTILIDKHEKDKRKAIRNREYYQENKEIYKEKYQDKLKKQKKLSREEQNSLIRAKIKSLLAEGFKQKDIALQLKLGTATVKRHIKYMKENGLL